MQRRSFLFAGAAAPLTAAAPDDAHAALVQRLEPPAGRVDVVIDSDAYNEVDDQFAIVHALRSPERLNVEAIYAGPFVNRRAASPAEGMRQSYDEILRLLDLLELEAPEGFVQRGSERYLTGPEDGLESPAALDLIRRALEPREGPLYVMTLGCPTNVAAALIREPRIRDRVVVVWIGGQVHRDGGPADDFNIRQDYYASRTLFDSGVALVEIVGYLVSEQMRTTIWELERFLKGRSPVADYLFRIVEKYYYERRKSENDPWSKPIWDAAVSGWLVRPEWVPSRIAPSPILIRKMTWRLDASRHPVRVSTHVDRDAIFGDLFEKLAAR